MSIWVLQEQELPVSMLPDNLTDAHEQIVDLALVAASLLSCWAREAKLPPEVLLRDLAVGQAIERTTSPNKGEPYGS